VTTARSTSTLAARCAGPIAATIPATVASATYASSWAPGTAIHVTPVVAASPVPVHLSVDLADRLPAPVEAALYFCCVEALQNVAKHSRATRADVRVSRTAGEVELVVSDDGTGFPAPPTGAGNGLANMRDRAESLGGELRVSAQPGRGTVVTVRAALSAGEH
jgi:nitrate/nitrite-specific signal transduction histidine kinase